MSWRRIWRSRTFSIFTLPICQQHSHRTERAITKALFRYNLSTTSSSPAKRNQNWGMQKQTGLMGPRRGSFEMNLGVKKWNRKIRGLLRALTRIYLNWILGTKKHERRETPLGYVLITILNSRNWFTHSQKWFSLEREHTGWTPLQPPHSQTLPPKQKF